MKWFYNERGESVWKMYFSFRGRIDRLTLWLRIVLMNVFTYVVLMTMSSMSTEYTSINYGSWLNCVLVVYWWCLTTLWVRRVHDFGRTGWWYGGFAIAVPLIFALNVWANFHMDPADPLQPTLTTAGLALIAAAVVWALYMVVRFGFRRGTVGENAYGPDPLAPKARPHEAAMHKGHPKKRRVKRVKRPRPEGAGSAEEKTAAKAETAEKAPKESAPAEGTPAEKPAASSDEKEEKA